MKTISRAVAVAAALGCANFACGIGARAQDYPTHPITMIVPFPAGGPTDTLGRIIGERMRVSLGQPIVIENVTGAGSTIGVGRAAQAAPDGYTLSLGNGAPGMYISFWHGLWVTKGTPKEVIIKLNGAVVDTLADPAVRQHLTDLGQVIATREQQTPAALGAFHKAEIEKWWPIIKAANIKVEGN